MKKIIKISKGAVVLGGLIQDKRVMQAVMNTQTKIGKEYDAKFVVGKVAAAAKFHLSQHSPQQRREEIKEIIRTFRKYLGQE